MTAWGSVVGSVLQFGVQLPTVLRLIDRIRPELTFASAHVRQVLHSFFPVFMSRGVVQISAFVDAGLASFRAGAGRVSNTSRVLHVPVVCLACDAEPPAGDVEDLDASVSRRRGAPGWKEGLKR